MRSLNEILLPIEFSPRCADVARYAAGVARQFQSKITLLHVLPPINWTAMGEAALVADILENQRQETCHRLDGFLTQELQGLAVDRLVCEGDAAETIAEYCAANQVGLVMMPTRGCSGFRRFLLGSVTAKILHDVHCPVWTSSHVTDGRAAVSVIPKVIVCAVDPTPEGAAVLHWASDLASDLQARLVVASAIPSLEVHPETYYLEADMRRTLIGDAHARISQALQGGPTPAAEIRVEGGSVSTVVRSVVEDSRADLLIIGRASGKGIVGRLRTHSYALIRESPCPVISI
jgi:nucleotide-binding universal stress UspA family protein